MQELAERALAECGEQSARLKKAQFLLRVPRFHQKFIETHGVDPFIEKLMLVLAEHENVQELANAKQERIKRRQEMHLTRSTAQRVERVTS